MKTTRRNILLTLLLCLLTALPAMAQSVNQTEVLRKINATASALKTMQCDFVQTKYLKMLNDKLVSKGRMYYQQSDKLRWEYTSPYAYTFVLNGQKVKLTKGQRSDVIDVNQSKVFREIARIMMNTVTGKSLASGKDFRVSITQTQGEWVATLLPQRKEMKQMFQKIVLHFSKSAAMVSTVELIEKKGDRTVIQLKNVQKNKAVNAKLFAVN